LTERRFLVLEVHNDKANRREYFDPIFEQMEKEGGLEAMLYELLNREMVSNLRRPPITGALVEQRGHSLDAMHRWLLGAARDGEIANAEDRNRPFVLSDNETLEVPRALVLAAAKLGSRESEQRNIDTQLPQLLASIGVEKGREGAPPRRYTYVFPPLYDLRDAVERLLRVPGHEQSSEKYVQGVRAAERGQKIASALDLKEMTGEQAEARPLGTWHPSSGLAWLLLETQHGQSARVDRFCGHNCHGARWLPSVHYVAPPERDVLHSGLRQLHYQ
jgi:hypothetical protein